MAKRFTDTEKWKKSWFCKLTERERHFWSYINDNCDHAGIWQVNWPLVDFYAPNFSQEFKMESFEGQIEVLTPDKWLLTEFVQSQYGNLNPASKTHQSVINLLEKERVSIGYPKGIHTLKDKDTDTVKDKDMVKAFGKSENLFFGDVPEDLMNLASILDPRATAGEWQDYVKAEIEKIGYVVEKEVPCLIDQDRNGRIDLIANKDDLQIAIELDYRTPRAKSIIKVKLYPAGMVLLRDLKTVHTKATKLDFEAVWIRYPVRLGKREAETIFTQTVKTEEDYTNINKAMDNLLKSRLCTQGDPKFIPHGSKWFKNWQDWINYKDKELNDDVPESLRHIFRNK